MEIINNLLEQAKRHPIISAVTTAVTIGFLGHAVAFSQPTSVEAAGKPTLTPTALVLPTQRPTPTINLNKIQQITPPQVGGRVTAPAATERVLQQPTITTTRPTSALARPTAIGNEVIQKIGGSGNTQPTLTPSTGEIGNRIRLP